MDTTLHYLKCTMNTALRCHYTLDLPHRIGLFVHPCNLYVQEVQEADRGQPQPHPHQKFHYVPIYVSKHLKALPSSLLKILTVQIVCCSGLCTCTMYIHVPPVPKLVRHVHFLAPCHTALHCLCFGVTPKKCKV